MLAVTAALVPLAAAAEPLALYRIASGSLPPEFAWSVTTTIAESGKIIHTDCAGYATEGPDCTVTSSHADPKALAIIRAAAQSADILARPPASDPVPPIGGGTTSGAVWLDGIRIDLPAFPVEADLARTRSVLAAITAAIPSGTDGPRR